MSGKDANTKMGPDLEFERWLVWKGTTCCRVVCVLLVSCLVIMLSFKLEDSVVLEGGSKDTALAPSCHAILYDVNANGIMLKAEEIGGGTIVDFGTINVTIGKLEVGAEKIECGDKNPTKWSKSKEKFNGRGFALPVIGWLLFRFAGLALEYLKRYGTLNESETACGREMFKKVEWLVFGVGATVLITGITNLEASKDHPQIMVTYYSPQTQWYLTMASYLIIVDVLCLGCLVWKFRELPEASTFLGQLFNICFMNSKILLQEARDREAQNRDGSWFKLAALIIAAPPGILVVFILACLYYRYLELSFSYTLVLGFAFHLELRWPKFSLSTTINALHVLSALLSVLDALTGLIGPCYEPAVAFMARPLIKKMPDRFTGLNSKFKNQEVWLKHKIERSKEHQHMETVNRVHEFQKLHPPGSTRQCHPQNAQSSDVGAAVSAAITDVTNAMGGTDGTGRKHPCCGGPEGSPGCKMHCSNCNQFYSRFDGSGCRTQCQNAKCKKWQEDCSNQICYTEQQCKVCKAVNPKRRCTDKKCYVQTCQQKGVFNPEGNCCQKNYDECSLAEKRRAVSVVSK